MRTLAAAAAAVAAVAVAGNGSVKWKLARAGFLDQSGWVGTVDCLVALQVVLLWRSGRCCCGAVSSCWGEVSSPTHTQFSSLKFVKRHYLINILLLLQEDSYCTASNNLE